MKLWFFCRRHRQGRTYRHAKKAGVPLTLALAAWELYEVPPADIDERLAQDPHLRGARMSWLMRLVHHDDSYTE